MKISNKEAVFILSSYDIGAGKQGAADGPVAVKDSIIGHGVNKDDFILLNNALTQKDFDGTFTHAKYIDIVLKNSKKLEAQVVSVFNSKRIPIILSGDHSNAIGGLSGLKNANPDKTIGVIWIDAHADIHSPYTTPSGNLHGMPLAALAGLDNREVAINSITEKETYYWNELKKLGIEAISPKFDLKNLVFIGIRDAEDQEWEIIEKMGIKTFEPDDIRAFGIQNVLEQTLAYIDGCDLIYVSFDADSLDPEISVGTGTPSPDGLKKEEASIIFKTLMQHPKLGAFEITEVNPNLDENGKEMAKIIADLIIKAI